MVNVTEITSKITKEAIASTIDSSVKVLDLNDVPADKLDQLVKIAMHCALNGPVGVDKVATFPGITGQTNIKSVLPTMTSTVWKQFVKIIALQLESYPAEIKNSYCKSKFGQCWPLCDAVFVQKPRDSKGNRISNPNLAQNRVV